MSPKVTDILFDDSFYLDPRDRLAMNASVCFSTRVCSSTQIVKCKVDL